MTAKKSKLFWQKLEQHSKDNQEENKSASVVASDKLEILVSKPSDAFEDEGEDLHLFLENDYDDEPSHSGPENLKKSGPKNS